MCRHTWKTSAPHSIHTLTNPFPVNKKCMTVMGSYSFDINFEESLKNIGSDLAAICNFVAENAHISLSFHARIGVN